MAEAIGEWRVPNNPNDRRPDEGHLEELLLFAWRVCGPSGGELEIERAGFQLTWKITPTRGGNVISRPKKTVRTKR